MNLIKIHYVSVIENQRSIDRSILPGGVDIKLFKK